jgi:hypothetical protein
MSLGHQNQSQYRGVVSSDQAKWTVHSRIDQGRILSLSALGPSVHWVGHLLVGRQLSNLGWRLELMPVHASAASFSDCVGAF